MPEKLKLSFVDGVHPSVYQTEKKSSHDGSSLLSNTPPGGFGALRSSSSGSNSKPNSRPSSHGLEEEMEATAVPLSGRRSQGNKPCIIL